MRWLIAVVLLTVGCNRDRTVEIDVANVPPADVLLDERIELPEGIVLSTIVRPLRHGEVMDQETEVHLRSEDPDVLGVATSLDAQAVRRALVDDGEWAFVLWGASEGATKLVVMFDGQVEVILPVTVLPPEPP